MTASRHHHHHHTVGYHHLGQHQHHHHHHQQGGKLAQWLRSISWPQRKLFLLVFLWTCVCLIVFKTSLLSSSLQSGQSLNSPAPPPSPPAALQSDLDYLQESARSWQHLQHPHLAARSASSLKPAYQQQRPQPSGQSSPTLEILAPEFDLPSADSSSAPLRRNHQQPLKSTHEHHATSSNNVIPSKSTLANSESGQRTRPLSEQANFDKSTAATGGGDKLESKAAQAKQSTTTSQATQQSEKHAAHLPAKSKSSHQIILGDQCHYSYPNLFDLQFNNIHWQKLVSQGNGDTNSTSKSSQQTHHPHKQQRGATFYLYNAYYDDRWRAGLPSVRVLAMIDRIHPPPTNCLLWSSKLPTSGSRNTPRPIVTRAQFVYAWYPKWGNYEDGLLQPWIVTCPMPHEHVGLVPESVSLVDVPAEQQVQPVEHFRAKRENQAELVPPSFSSSSSSSSAAAPLSSHHLLQQQQATSPLVSSTMSTSMKRTEKKVYDCNTIGLITNNLPVFNRRPVSGKREKFAVCVKGLDFPFDGPDSRVSIRLVEWIEMLSLLGAKKIFLYNLDVHENISKVLNYYQQRGLVELSPLTLPGDQPNLPEYQHLYLKQKLTSKRQNELIPYNDCLYRNLYSYEYLALLDIDEIIMPLKEGHTTWYDLMGEVERLSLSEQNYSRASYNVRNVYFFDDLSGPLGTTQANTQPQQVAGVSSSSTSGGGDDEDSNESLLNNLLAESDAISADSNSNDESSTSSGESRAPVVRPHRDSAERGIPHYLHMMSHVYRSKNYTEPGQYVKCFHNTERVISLHNHFPMNCFGQCTTYSIPLDLAHLQHYRKDCVGPLRQSCKNDFRLFTTRDTTIWRYKSKMIRRTTRVLNHLELLGTSQATGARFEQKER